MAWNKQDESVDWDELGSLLRVLSTGQSGIDLRLYITVNNTPIRADGDIKLIDVNCLGAVGYAFKGQVLRSDYSLSTSNFWLLRNVDSVTASISSFLVTSAAGGKWKSGEVILEVHRSGGEDLVSMIKKPLPFLKFTLGDAYCAFQAIITSIETGAPMEVLGFNYKSIEIATAEQSESGIFGKARVCRISGDW
jgi:hypothetical protein